jgi:hypothetical protein
VNLLDAVGVRPNLVAQYGFAGGGRAGGAGHVCCL